MIFVKVLDKFEIENENIGITFYVGNHSIIIVSIYIRECMVPE